MNHQVGAELIGDAAVDTMQLILGSTGIFGGIASIALAPIVKPVVNAIVVGGRVEEPDQTVGEMLHDQAKELAAKGDAKGSAEKLAAAARMNCVPAIMELAQGVEKEDPDQAKVLYQRAADLGSKDAPLILALLETTLDRSAGMKQLLALAKQGDKWATVLYLECLIADEKWQEADDFWTANFLMFYKAEPIQQCRFTDACAKICVHAGDYKYAKRFYKLLVKRGYTPARISYAKLIEKEDPKEARKQLQLAIKEGELDAYAYLARMLQNSEPQTAMELYYQGLSQKSRLAREFLQEYCNFTLKKRLEREVPKLIAKGMDTYPGDIMMWIASYATGYQEGYNQLRTYLDARGIAPKDVAILASSEGIRFLDRPSAKEQK